MSDDTDILRALDERAAFHLAEAEKYRLHLAEAEKYRSAAAALRGAEPTIVQIKPRRRRSEDPRASTMTMIDLVLVDMQEPITAGYLVDQMLERGWQTTSAAPVNTVRTALARLEDKGSVVRTADGRFLDARRVIFGGVVDGGDS